jgi:hypothetical protein
MENLEFISVIVVSCLNFIIKLLQQMITKENMDIFSSSNRVLQESSTKAYVLALVTLHQHHMTNICSLSPNLGHWVKPRSNAWFSTFLLTKYDDDHWVQNFRMTKRLCSTLLNK